MNRFTRTTRARAFTLVEVVTAMGVAAIAGGLIVRLYFITTAELNREHDRLRQTSEVRQVLWQVKRDLRATARVEPAWRDYRTGEHTAVLLLPALDDRSRARTDAFDRVVYQSTDHGIERSLLPDRDSSREPSVTQLAGGQTRLSFDYDGPLRLTNLVTVHVEDSRSQGKRESTLPATATVRLRNQL